MRSLCLHMFASAVMTPRSQQAGAAMRRLRRETAGPPARRGPGWFLSCLRLITLLRADAPAAAAPLPVSGMHTDIQRGDGGGFSFCRTDRFDQNYSGSLGVFMFRKEKEESVSPISVLSRSAFYSLVLCFMLSNRKNVKIINQRDTWQQQT